MVNEKQRKTFLSYSRANKDFAIKLAKELKTEGFYVWLDQLDIPAGARWDREVEKALKECEVFMIIMTPASIDSENVLDEIGYAIDNGKHFLPVLLENCTVPLRLRRFQYVDFTNKSFDEGVESAKALLRDLVAQTTTPRVEVPAKSQDQIAQAEMDRPAKQQAEDKQLAIAKTETDRKAKEEADHLAAQKAEETRLAKQKADDELATKAKAETERKAKEEADLLAAQKVEAERKAKEEAKPVDEKAEHILVPAATQKKPMSKGLVIGIVAVVVLVIAGIGIGVVSNRGVPATKLPDVLNGKQIIGQWERSSAEMTEYFNIQNDGSYTIESISNSTNEVIASSSGRLGTNNTASENRVVFFDVNSKITATQTYYLSGGGDILVIDNQVDQAWTRISGIPATEAPVAPPVTEVPAFGLGSTMTGNDGMTLHYVPAGEFTMGDGADDAPVHKVNLDAFWIDETEVTNALYIVCVDAGVCALPDDTSKYNDTQYAQHPVVFVNWSVATAYCEWAGRRLPTEAEWEKAARGPDGRIYPWGNDAPNNSLLNFDGIVGNTTEVGKYPNGASPYGAYDMAANVWELVNDWYDSLYYQNSPSLNPVGPASGEYRGLRGGSWDNDKYLARSAFRGYKAPWNADGYIGFRCSRSP